MTNWNHVKNETTRSLLKGIVPADLPNLAKALYAMLGEQAEDYSNMEIPEEVFWSRADSLDKAHEAYTDRDKGLCMNRIKTFYSV